MRKERPTRWAPGDVTAPCTGHVPPAPGGAESTGLALGGSGERRCRGEQAPGSGPRRSRPVAVTERAAAGVAGHGPAREGQSWSWDLQGSVQKAK